MRNENMTTNDNEIIATCLKPEIHKLNEKLTKEHRSQATEAEFLGAFEIAMRNMINQARADEREKAKLDFMANVANHISDSAVAFATNKQIEQAKADTAKQIFKELDAIAWEQIEPSRLEEFYEQFSNAKDLKASLNVATAFSIIGLDAEKYEALKKQYNIEE